MFAQPALAQHSLGETSPGPGVETDADVLAYARKFGNTSAPCQWRFRSWGGTGKHQRCNVCAESQDDGILNGCVKQCWWRHNHN